MRRYLLTSEGMELALQETAGDLSQVATPLLAGGFNLLSPDPPCPLSPTLQLNADLSASSPEQLLRTARAERHRLLSRQLKSYIYTVEPRAAVIATNPEPLADFLDLYGGILETVPILFSAASRRPEYIPAEELELTALDRGTYLIRCSSRTPVDRQRCTWCRACAAACKEQCISPGLDINFDRCTFCGDCVEACPAGAIDLYARAEKKFKVPAVILLGNPDIELPADRQMIFTEREIEAFLRQLGDHHLEETVGYHRERCQYSSRLQLGCRQCIEACSHGALQRGEDGIMVDHLACRDCGACIAACPTGALQDERFHDRDFIAYFEQLQLPGQAVVVIGSEPELLQLWWHNAGRSWNRVFFLEYPQVNTLTAMHFLFLFAIGFSRVVLVDDGKAAGEPSAATREQQLAGEIVNRLFAIPGFVTTMTGRDFTGAVNPEKENPLSTTYGDFSYTSRRRKLASVLQFLLAAGESTTVDEPWPGENCCPTYGRLQCDEERCTACVACLNECYTGALTSDQENYTLRHKAALCVQCGICVAVCPEQALSLDPGLVLAPSFMQNKILSRAEPMVCPRCGARFGTKKSYQHVINLLRETGRFAEQEEVLGYCETCRAVKMFESHAK